MEIWLKNLHTTYIIILTSPGISDSNSGLGSQFMGDVLFFNYNQRTRGNVM